MIAKADLIDGAYYEGVCRNAVVARWDAKAQRFYHLREKWGRQFIEDICHPEDEKRWDVFEPTLLLKDPDDVRVKRLRDVLA